MSSSSRKPPRTSSTGRGGGGRGRPPSSSSRRGGHNNRSDELSDEDVLIAFMPYIRNGDADATRIHEMYSHDQRMFVTQVRMFLDGKKSESPEKNNTETIPAPFMTEQAIIPTSPTSPPVSREVTSTPILSPQPGKTPFPTPNSVTPAKSTFLMGDLADRMDGLGIKEDPVFVQQSPVASSAAFGSSTISILMNSPPPPPPFSPAPQAAQPISMAPIGTSRSPGTIGRTIATPSAQPPVGLPTTATTSSLLSSPPPSMVASSTVASLPTLSPTLVPPPNLQPKEVGVMSSLLEPSPVVPPSGNWVPCAPGPQAAADPSSPSRAAPTTPEKTSATTPTISPLLEPLKAQQPPKKEHQPKRLWTRVEEQPGRLMANNVPPTNEKTFRLRPRQELTAKWMLPLAYLRQRNKNNDNQDVSLRQALEGLAVGLFRQGCSENGSTVSIISKEVLSPPEESRQDYPFEIDSRSDTVWGTIPFYSPRTPGHVVMRLYWQSEPLYTLATGPRLYVCVTNNADVEPSLRFILSNFKSKSKNNNTSLSSLHSLAAVLEQFNPPREPRNNNNNNNSPTNNYRKWEGAGRATWGCICESKKVLEACAAEYLKTKEKHFKLEDEVNELQAQVDAEEEMLEMDGGDSASTTAADKLREKKNTLMGGRASNERRWKDSQLAFASILRAVVNNSAISLLLKRDLLSELRLEYELWCPLCEAFAPSPFRVSDETSSSSSSVMVDTLCVNRNLLPRPITGEHFRMFIKSRIKMQIDTLGFEPNNKRLEDVLMPNLRNANKSRSPNAGRGNPPPTTMDPTAVGAFNILSTAMCKLYQDVYMTSDRVHQEREMVRAQIENIVAQCPAFPPGTKVVVFGSAANGFGSPTSDLDMCLQLPPNTELPKQDDDEDKTGARAMAQLAELFDKAGLQDVDTARLTARIPVIKFYFPRQGDDEAKMECDLSMQNPLACLNTSLLLTYSRINPMTNVLASIIKRWAKKRDINNPSRHTLSSYGYILMLLHFLTYHQSFGNGQVLSLARREDEEHLEKPPLLPNLQWMDMNWPQSPIGTPYRELSVRPKNLILHPSEKDFVVNAYFFRLSDQAALTNLQRRFSGQDSSVAILLASFFRYYAFEFDYKKHVVSLHSTALRGLVEREVKAEFDCWKVYFQGLAIEDPFETFYDVAHVVKGSSFHRLRHELALAYTKIVDAASMGGASNKRQNWHKKDLSSMTGMDLIDWICEPTDKDE